MLETNGDKNEHIKRLESAGIIPGPPKIMRVQCELGRNEKLVEAATILATNLNELVTNVNRLFHHQNDEE